MDDDTPLPSVPESANAIYAAVRRAVCDMELSQSEKLELCKKVELHRIWFLEATATKHTSDSGLLHMN